MYHPRYIHHLVQEHVRPQHPFSERGSASSTSKSPEHVCDSISSSLFCMCSSRKSLLGVLRPDELDDWEDDSVDEHVMASGGS